MYMFVITGDNDEPIGKTFFMLLYCPNFSEMKINPGNNIATRKK